MEEETWKKEADKFLKNPPMKSRFKRDDGQKDLSLVTRQRNPSSDFRGDNNRLIHAVFAAFVDLVIESVPLDKQENTRAHISSVFSSLNLVPKAFFTNEFSSIRQALASVVSTALGSVFSPHVNRSITTPPPLFPDPQRNRYLADFEEIEVIGEGGFGKVYKVKSRVDGHLYAVKKIRLKKTLNHTSYMNVINEVKVLGSLHHPNIVRYHCGWWDVDTSSFRISPEPRKKVEFSPVKVQEITDDEEDTNILFDKNRSATPFIQELRPESPDIFGDSPEPLTESPKPIGDSPQMAQDEDCNTTVEDEGLDGKDSSESSFTSSSSGDNINPTTAVGKFWGRGASSDGDSSREGTILSVEDTTATQDTVASEHMEPERPMRLPQPFSWLPVFHIQMELCTSTLEQHLAKRNSHQLDTSAIDGAFNRDLCIQLLSAVQYIHGNHLIHRDIKPANIFLKPSGCHIRFLLGDFGLACPDLNEVVEENAEKEDKELKPRRPRRSSCHSVGVGTTTYAAPEQLQSSDYGPLVDIYSTGVVLFEVYNSFSTAMERMKAIEQLRGQRKVPNTMEEQWPTVMEAVLKMTDPKPSRRPSASQLLQKLTVEESSVISHLEEIILSKNKRIKELEQEVARLKAEALRK